MLMKEDLKETIMNGIVGIVFTALFVIDLVICAAIGQFNIDAIFIVFTSICTIMAAIITSAWGLIKACESIHDWFKSLVTLKKESREKKTKKRSEID